MDKKCTKDTNSNLKYEHPSLFKFLFNLPVLILMSLFPYVISRIIINKSSKKAAFVHKNITTHAALDTLYDCGKLRIKKNNFFKNLAENIWFNLYNPGAVRNRLKLVSFFLEESIEEIIKNKKSVEIVSLASGSARAVINTVLKFQDKDKNIRFNIKLLDRNINALEISKKIVKKNNFNNNVNFEFINDKIRNFSDYYKNNKPDIVEMVGFLDYLDEEKSIKLISKIYKNLNKNGFFIVANIKNNHEKIFLDRALKWKMIYKNPKDLIIIFKKSGFKTEKINLLYEPFKIHGVAKIKKDF